MRFTWLKQIFILICLFSLLESTGISLIKLIAHTSITQEDKNTSADDDATERSESKIKEILAVEPFYNLSVPALHAEHFVYPVVNDARHLGYISPVPTPPPNVQA